MKSGDFMFFGRFPAAFSGGIDALIRTTHIRGDRF